MLSRALMLAAAVVAMGTLGADAQSTSSNPTMAPGTPGATKTETPGKNVKGAKKAKKEDPTQSSSTPTMAPTGPGTAGKTETPGTKAKVKGQAKQPDPPSKSSSTPTMAPSK